MKILVLTKRYTSAKDISREDVGRPYCLFAALAPLGHRVSFLLGDYTERAAFDARKGDIRLAVRPLSPARLPSFSRILSGELARGGHDVLIAEGDPLFALIASGPCRRAGVPLVYDLMDNYATYAIYRIPGFGAVDRRLMRRAELVVCVTEALRGRIAGVRRDAVCVVGNGVDVSAFRPMDRKACRRALGLPEGGRVIGYFGYLAGYKGLEILLRAHAMLRGGGFPALLLLAGNRGRAGIPAAEGVRDLGLIPHAEIPACINACDAVSIPNPSNDYTEFSFPLKALEAAACGVPIAATALVPVRDLLGDSPLLARPGDAEDLARALREACASRGDGLREVAEAHTWGRAAERLSRELGAVVGAPARGAVGLP